MLCEQEPPAGLGGIAIARRIDERAARAPTDLHDRLLDVAAEHCSWQALGMSAEQRDEVLRAAELTHTADGDPPMRSS